MVHCYEDLCPFSEISALLHIWIISSIDYIESMEHTLVGFFVIMNRTSPYLFFGRPEVLYVQQVPPPVILTILVSRAAIGPERAVPPVSEHPYIHQEYQHVGRGQSETDISIYTCIYNPGSPGSDRARTGCPPSIGTSLHTPGLSTCTQGSV